VDVGIEDISVDAIGIEWKMGFGWWLSLVPGINDCICMHQLALNFLIPFRCGISLMMSLFHVFVLHPKHCPPVLVSKE
jgi:hypothetical protein